MKGYNSYKLYVHIMYTTYSVEMSLSPHNQDFFQVQICIPPPVKEEN